MRPSWADHVPRRHLLPGRLPDGSPARRSAVAVLTATALLGVGTWTTATTAARAPATQPVTVLGLTTDGTCDPHTAERQHTAATDTRTQARALLTDLTLSADPADHALADQITELGFRPATQPPGWRQHAVDVADHLHHLTTTHPHSAHPHSADPQLSEVGVRLAAAGLGPTPADLIDPPPAADLINDTAAGADAALGAVDQALAAATTPPPAAATPPVARPRSAAPPIPAACTDHHPGTPTASPEQPPAGDKTAPVSLGPTREPAPAPAATAAELPAAAPPTTISSSKDRAADTTDLAPTSTKPDSTEPDSTEPDSTEPDSTEPDSTEPGGPRTSTPPATPSLAPPAASNRVVTDAQTGPGQTPSVEDVTNDAAAARAAIGMVSDLMAAIAADGGADATRIGSTILDALDTDRLAALGADPADLDTLDHLRDTTTSGSSGRSDQPTTASPKPTQAQARTSEQTSSGEAEVRPGAAITRTQPSQSSRASTTADAASGDESSDASSAGQRTSTSTPETQTRSPGSVSAGIEKLRTQARAAAEVDPVAQDLLDALDRTGTGAGTEDSKDGVEHGVERGRVSGSTGGTASTRNDTTDGDTADGADGLDRRAGEQSREPAMRAEPSPATGDAETGPATDSTFDNLAQCESGGDWSTNTGNGYVGGLQFSPSTWRAFGGQGAAHEASRAEQIEVAKRVQAVQGWAAWPTCSTRLGLR
ncbi:Methylcrotonyl-CoA carboxylase biotin-containing subunit [Pseudonocardia sp. Ae331_Ps2]|nr:Methylcrotonyl-CoA carboxylase biotin-containing subunit [Pseudonocardia sp. Ae331_Ps2]